jgi:hypothetical protein
MNAHIGKPIAKRALLDAVSSCAASRPPVGSVMSSELPCELFSRPTVCVLEQDAGREKMLQLVDAILGKLERTIDRMRDDTVKGAFSRVQGEAHKLTSSTGLIGLLRLSALFSFVEEKARVAALSGNPDDLADLVDQLRDVAQMSVPLLQSHISGGAGGENNLMEAVA